MKNFKEYYEQVNEDSELNEGIYTDFKIWLDDDKAFNWIRQNTHRNKIVWIEARGEWMIHLDALEFNKDALKKLIKMKHFKLISGRVEGILVFKKQL